MLSDSKSTGIVDSIPLPGGIPVKVRCPDEKTRELDCDDARDPLCARALVSPDWSEDGGFVPVSSAGTVTGR